MRFLKPYLITTVLVIVAVTLSAADYYWVGGSGNWSDISRWATTSGGTTQHNQIPTANDRVIFDANSFTAPGQTVTVNNQTIFCKDMIWTNVTNNPRFVGPADFTMNIYGSLRLSANMVFEFNGDVRFVANDGGHEIDLTGQQLRRDVYFDGNNGSWTLRSTLVLNRLLTVRDGTLNTNNQEIRCQHVLIQAVNNVALNLGTSRLLATGVPFPDPIITSIERPVVEVFAERLTLNADNSTIELSSDKPFFRGKGFGDLNLGTVLFSNTAGNGRLFSDPTLSFRFQRLEMRNDTEVRGIHRLGVLALGPGKTFFFQASATYELNRLTAQGTCPAPIQIFSSSPGEAVTFRATTGTITGDYLSLRDIRATGGATFTATNSADLGNNQGWTIMPKANNRLYWVGGSGNWYDPARWSFSSGGPGGACVPTAGDDVFFDANSFPTANAVVTINVENAYCRSMTWTGATGNPRLEGTVDQKIRIFGSLTFIANMQMNFAGDFYFESSTAGNTITTAGKVLKRDAIFNGSGDWTLLDAFEAETDIIFRQGRINSNNQRVTCQFFDANFPGARALNMGNSTFNLRYLVTNNKQRSHVLWQTNSENFQLDAGNSTIDFQFYGFMYDNGEAPLTYNRVISRYWIDFRNLGRNFSRTTRPIFIDSLKNETEARFFGPHVLNVWEVTPAYAYQIWVRDTLTVTEIIAPNVCRGMVELRCVEDDNVAYINATRTQTVTNFILKDVHSIGAGALTANSSIDLGNNNGWTINNKTGRNLYWVGGSGSWHDPAHWSLSSGGPGGECIPTPLDNVFFDANSFTAPGQVVNANDGRLAYCRNMTWQGVTRNPAFEMFVLHCFGSITLVPQMTVNIFNSLYLRSENPGQTVTTAGHRIFSLFAAGSGSWTLQDRLNIYYFLHENGVFNSNGAPVYIEYYYYAGQTASPKVLQLGNSHWTIAGAIPYSFQVIGNNTTIEPGASLIEMTHPNAILYSLGTVRLHNVLFSNLQGSSGIEVRGGNTVTFNRLEFRNSGTMTGQSVVDSLIFSAGKAYRLDSNAKQVVNKYWQVLGNNCNSIELSSTIAGARAIVEMNGGTVRGDFIQMRDQEGRGSTRFFAGANSTNIGNSNVNWVFDTPREYAAEGILGEDKVLCNSSSLTLNANTFNPSERYRWQDGSANATFNVTRPGLYWVEVTYDNNCVLRDTVNILAPQTFEPRLPGDTSLCTGDTLFLNTDLGLTGVRYRWQDGSIEPTFTVSRAGKYKVTLELSGCTVSDSLEVRYTAIPTFDLGSNRTLCPGDTAVLSVNYPNAAFRWQDGSTNPNFIVRQPGVYRLTITENGCSGRDSVTVSYNQPFNLNLGRDTSFCENSQLTLTANVPSATYRWSNGRTESTITVGVAGSYWLEATLNGCTERDTVNVTQRPLPVFNLGRDTVLCTGETLVLNGTVAGATFLWNDNRTEPTRTVNAQGLYWLEVTLAGCSRRDSININFVTIPNDFLGANLALCEGETRTLNPGIPGATYRWQDGSTGSTFTVRQSGRITAEVQVSGCRGTDTIEATFRPSPRFSLGNDTTICSGETLNLRVNATADDIRWQDGSTNPTLSVNRAGAYSAQATRDGCTWADTLQVRVLNAPAIALGKDTTACNDKPLMLKANAAAEQYKWSDGSTTSSISVDKPGVYTLEASNGRCAAQSTIRVDFRRCLDFRLFAPNAFSPNGDGINDEFKPYLPEGIIIRDYEMRVFDRWGNLMFTSNDLTRGWDGAYGQKPMPGGVYVYYIVIQYTDDRGNGQATFSGDVALVR